MELMKKVQKKRKGFTLIELIVVVTIIGILLLIAVPRFTSMSDAANRRTFEANHRIVASAIGMYIAENNGAKPNAGNKLDKYLTTATSGAGFAALNNNPDGATYVVAANGTLTSTYKGRTLTYTP